jgi:hypothetical protein
MTFNLPREYKNDWNIWSDNILDRIEFSDCNNSVKGYCTINKTTEECIDSCKAEDCYYGYNITLSNNKRICANIAHKSKNDNPTYRLIPKDSIDELKNVKIDTFINKHIFPFPPNNGKKIFFKDLCILENTNTSMSINISDFSSITSGVINTPIKMSKNDRKEVCILPSKPIPYLDKFTTVTYGDRISLHIPNTTLFMKALSNSVLNWGTAVMSHYMDEYAIILESLTKKNGEQISYGDTFLIKMLGGYVIYNIISNTLEITNFNKEKAIKHNGTFKFNSNREAYYCENNTCKSISIDKISHDKKYNDLTTYRNKNCWNLCNKNSQPKMSSVTSIKDVTTKSNDKINYIYLYLITIIILLIIINIFLKYF